MGPVSAEVASLVRVGARSSAEEARDLAVRLEQLLDCMVAEARGPERYELRLAGALAGNLADELEAIVLRRAGSPPCESIVEPPPS
jgi:hypothetical protein